MAELQKIGRYEIVEEKGRGAMGAVYVARDPAMDRLVAVKTIHSLALQGPQASEYRERFYRESRSAGRLAHPGIVAMFDVGEQDGLPYLVMEFIEGKTLADAAKGGERFSLERVCEIGQQLAEALGYAHKNGVVHRDIKPANILLTSKEKFGIERPKITDFGVAKVTAAQITTTGQMLGTPAFMPPEQFTGATIDGRSDLFSLGVILYWLATGEQAFPGETVTAVSYKVVHTEPVLPRKLNPSIPTGLEHVIVKCLSKDPAARYQTGEQLAHDLAAVRSGRSAADLASTVNITAAPGSDSGMDVTLDPDPRIVSTATKQPTVNALAATVAAVQVQPVTPKNTSGGGSKSVLGIVAGTVIVMAIASAFYIHKNRANSVAPPPATVTAPVSEPPKPQPATNDANSMWGAASPDTPIPQTPAAESKDTKKAENTSSSAKKSTKVLKNSTDVAASTPAPSVTPPPAPVVETPKPAPAPIEPARVDFDPKALNPSENTRLRVEADRFPQNIDFTIEMDGKIYFERGAAKTQTLFENLLTTPGIHEFRVIAGTGTNRKTSNIVSTEFKAKKKKTLRIELRSQGKPTETGIPQDVYADSQIVVSLK